MKRIITLFTTVLLALCMAVPMMGQDKELGMVVDYNPDTGKWFASTNNNHDLEIIEQTEPEAERIFASGTFWIESNELYIRIVREGPETPFRYLSTVKLITDNGSSGCWDCNVSYHTRTANATGGRMEAIHINMHSQAMVDFLDQPNPRIKIDEFTFGLTPEFVQEFTEVWERAHYGIQID